MFKSFGKSFGFKLNYLLRIAGLMVFRVDHLIYLQHLLFIVGYLLCITNMMDLFFLRRLDNLLCIMNKLFVLRLLRSDLKDKVVLSSLKLRYQEAKFANLFVGKLVLRCL